MKFLGNYFFVNSVYFRVSFFYYSSILMVVRGEVLLFSNHCSLLQIYQGRLQEVGKSGNGSGYSTKFFHELDEYFVSVHFSFFSSFYYYFTNNYLSLLKLTFNLETFPFLKSRLFWSHFRSGPSFVLPRPPSLSPTFSLRL